MDRSDSRVKADSLPYLDTTIKGSQKDDAVSEQLNVKPNDLVLNDLTPRTDNGLEND